MKSQYITNRQGKDFVLYEGLLDEAHQQGLKRISTTLIQIPHDNNGNIAVVSAEVETEKGVFAGIGDAAPNNVNRVILPHLIRMAETRAKARALRDAINVGETSVEELGGNDADPEEDHAPAKGGGDAAARQREQNRATREEREADDSMTVAGITPSQQRAIKALCEVLKEQVPPDLEAMTLDDAAGLIVTLNERKSARQR